MLYRFCRSIYTDQVRCVTDLQGKLAAVHQLTQTAQDLVLQTILEAALQSHAFISNPHRQYCCSHFALVMLTLQM